MLGAAAPRETSSAACSPAVAPKRHARASGLMSEVRAGARFSSPSARHRVSATADKPPFARARCPRARPATPRLQRRRLRLRRPRPRRSPARPGRQRRRARRRLRRRRRWPRRALPPSCASRPYGAGRRSRLHVALHQRGVSPARSAGAARRSHASKWRRKRRTFLLLRLAFSRARRGAPCCALRASHCGPANGSSRCRGRGGSGVFVAPLKILNNNNTSYAHSSPSSSGVGSSDHSNGFT